MKHSIFLLCLFLISSCKTDFNDVEIPDWNPSYAVPLINTSVNMENLLDSFSTGGFIHTNDDKLLTLVYEGQVFSVQGQELFEIPNEFSIPFFDTLQVFAYDAFAGAEIHRMHLNDGQLVFDFTSETNEALTVLFKMSNFKQNGEVLEVMTSVEALETKTVSVDVAGYEFTMVDNEYEVYYSATRNNGQKEFLKTCEVGFNNLGYSYVEGYLDKIELDLPLDSIVLDIFANPEIASGTVFIESPTIRMDIQNTFGVPIRLGVESLTATRDNSSLNLTGDFVDNGLNLLFPSLSQVGEAQTTSLELNENNSNLAPFISLLPKQITYDISASVNPDEDPNIIGHITDSSYFKIDVDVELPLYGRANNFNFEKEFEFDVSIYEDVESASFKLITENGFPLDIDIQLYFLDEDGAVLDSLLTGANQQLLQAAPVDGNGRVTTFNTTEVEEVLPAARFGNINVNAKKIRVRSGLATLNNGTESVRIYSDYTVGIRLGLIATIK